MSFRLLIKGTIIFLIVNCQLSVVNSLHAQTQNINPPFLTPESAHWADSVFQTMTYNEKIGQLFIAATLSDNMTTSEQIDSLICNYQIGGLMFLKGSPMRQAQLTNHYQQLSKIPLLITIDGEWGLSMRLDSTIRFPRQMTLGA
ncbi:MAG: glycoside hydrolase family 3 N-terminal domain-containing protein, partial [Bacteroidia bacterium]